MGTSLESLITSFPVVIGVVAVAGFVVQRTIRAKANRRIDEAFRQSRPASPDGGAQAPTAPMAVMPTLPAAPVTPGSIAKRTRAGLVLLGAGAAVVVARQAYFGNIAGDFNETMRLAFDPDAARTARLVGTGSLVLAGALGVWGAALLASRVRSGSVVGPALLSVGLVAGLFLAYRGLAYSRCKSSCQVDCEAVAQQGNPFAGFGVRNDLGRALCESRVRDCLASCRFP